ncbi:hypothetical protein VTK73DRAFT_6716 [Phialemonium thermophilum]|uniref:U3 small nucleolar RNA-associated protein 25 n=1 Tax=Phialemonium thermophilum TaxID=223376 RepID=A0ABR3XWK0_9PEZI
MALRGHGGAKHGKRKFSAGLRGGRVSKSSSKPELAQDHGARFTASRVAGDENDDGEELERDETVGTDVMSDDDRSSEEDEDHDTESAAPYLSLMRSLTESNPRQAKRRKVEISSGNQSQVQRQEDSFETGVNDLDHSDASEQDENEELSPDELFDDDDDLDSSDPFEVHFADPDEKDVNEKILAMRDGKWQMTRVASHPWRLLINSPRSVEKRETVLPKPISGPGDLKLKQRLREAAVDQKPQFNVLEGIIAPLIFNHSDVLFCERTLANSGNLRWMSCLHALNHVYKTRDRVIKNNGKLAKATGDDELELRDQGFTRPKVLFILPTRQSCVKMVNMLCRICRPDQQENRSRFDASYVEKDQKFGDHKPADFKDLFEGNDDDMFRLGVKFTRKSIKFFSQFYNSDILFASPLGLRMAIGSEEDKKIDFDFLSSIELVVVDHADALLMQNWEHVEFIFEHLNVQPKDAHGCDFSRVRNWYLEDQAKYFRQTLIFSTFNTPELSEVFRSYCRNWAGKVLIQKEYHGTMLQMLGHKTRQTFSRYEPPSIQADPDARFTYFTKAIIPTLTKNPKDSAGTLIFIPSYLDFVRIRNYFGTNPAVESLTFGAISEYTDVPEASRARSYFLNGRQRVLLYTERAHHFRRYRIKGVKRVIMYGLPDNPLFYEEIAGGFLRLSEQALQLEPGQGSVRIIFSKYDVLKLERIVGSQRVGRMIREKGDTFDFI